MKRLICQHLLTLHAYTCKHTDKDKLVKCRYFFILLSICFEDISTQKALIRLHYFKQKLSQRGHQTKWENQRGLQESEREYTLTKPFHFFFSRRDFLSQKGRWTLGAETHATSLCHTHPHSHTHTHSHLIHIQPCVQDTTHITDNTFSLYTQIQTVKSMALHLALMKE